MNHADHFLSIRNVSKRFGDRVALNDVSIEIERGSFTSIVGANGSGKTTLLNVIAGLDTPTSGAVELSPALRGAAISYVFQNYSDSLLPWRTVRDNISLPLKLVGDARRERDATADDLVSRFQLDLDLNRYPYELSGGQKQLVVILRALVTDPSLLLLDEPFSALDFQKTLDLHEALLRIWEQTKATIILVSHDLDEALYLADRVLLIGGHPAGVLLDQRNSLTRPRQLSMIASPEFVFLKTQLLSRFVQSSSSALK